MHWFWFPSVLLRLCYNTNSSLCLSISSTHYITLREMSSQLSILSKIPGKGFWTAPSREQYLPAFFKEVCDNYLRDPDARELLPVKVSMCMSTFCPFLLERNLKCISEPFSKINNLKKGYSNLFQKIRPQLVLIGSHKVRR